MRILIVGGGMAGLSAAVALGRGGHDVTVVEATGKIDGAIISITNRGVDALEALGMLDAAAAVGFVISGTDSIYTNFFDGTGQPLAIPHVAPRSDTRLPASVSLLRADFSRILTGAATAVGTRIEIGRAVTALSQERDNVLVTFADGATEHFDLLVGADGVGSTIRALVLPDAPPPTYTGHMSFRWLVPDGPPGATGSYMLPDNTMLITLRLPDGTVYLSTGVDMARRHVPIEEARTLLDGVLARFPAPFIQALRPHIASSDAIVTRPYDWILVPRPWHCARVVLIGDAAHSTTAHMGAGGSIAVEDAVVLAEELASADCVGTALAAFEARRYPRAALVVNASVELLRLQQAQASPVESARLRAATVETLRHPY